MLLGAQALEALFGVPQFGLGTFVGALGLEQVQFGIEHSFVEDVLQIGPKQFLSGPPESTHAWSATSCKRLWCRGSRRGESSS